jgi:hypothetical protein
MVIPLHAQVTGFKVENLWRRKSRSSVRCTARLSRRLRAVEVERVEQLPDTFVERAQVVHDCGPEEIEHWHTRLVEALTGVGPGARPVAEEERKPRRVLRKTSADVPRPEPAA